MLKQRGFLLTVLLAWAVSCYEVDAGTGRISRQDLQEFLERPGNAATSPAWMQRYYDKPVSWQGVVYKVTRSIDDRSVEILLKVLPSTLLYDTVLIVSANHPLAKTVQSGQALPFQGVITGVVDTRIHREVHVTLIMQADPM